MIPLSRWSTIAIVSLALIAPIHPALSQSVKISPGSSKVQFSGTSGGKQKDPGCAGFVASAPNHTVEVSEDMDLRFVLRGTGQPALLIRGSTGQNFCVPADSFSQGKIEIPGRWRKGTYSIFIGDRANESHAYTLSISTN